jgi:hypothetical protein
LLVLFFIHASDAVPGRFNVALATSLNEFPET